MFFFDPIANPFKTDLVSDLVEQMAMDSKNRKIAPTLVSAAEQGLADVVRFRLLTEPDHNIIGAYMALRMNKELRTEQHLEVLSVLEERIDFDLNRQAQSPTESPHRQTSSSPSPCTKPLQDLVVTHHDSSQQLTEVPSSSFSDQASSSSQLPGPQSSNQWDPKRSPHCYRA